MRHIYEDDPNGVEPSITAYRQMCGVGKPTLPTYDPEWVEPYKASTGATPLGSDEMMAAFMRPASFQQAVNKVRPIQGQTIPSISWSTLRLYMGIRQFIDYQIIGREQKQDGLKAQQPRAQGKAKPTPWVESDS